MTEQENNWLRVDIQDKLPQQIKNICTMRLALGEENMTQIMKYAAQIYDQDDQVKKLLSITRVELSQPSIKKLQSTFDYLLDEHNQKDKNLLQIQSSFYQKDRVTHKFDNQISYQSLNFIILIDLYYRRYFIGFEAENQGEKFYVGFTFKQNIVCAMCACSTPWYKSNKQGYFVTAIIDQLESKGINLQYLNDKLTRTDPNWIETSDNYLFTTYPQYNRIRVVMSYRYSNSTFSIELNNNKTHTMLKNNVRFVDFICI